MSVTINVGLVRGIDYGADGDGLDAWRAWRWREQNDEARADGVADDLPQGGGRAPHFIIYAEASRVPVFDDWSDRPKAATLAVGDGREKEYDATLRAFCKSRDLPWREPRWLITVDMG